MTRNPPTSPTQDVTASEFRTVPLHVLRVDTVLEFDLYLPRAGSTPVLYRGRDLPMTAEVFDRLQSSGVAVLWVPCEQREDRRQYIERNLGSLVADQAVPLESRCETLYQSAHMLVRDVLENPMTGDLVARSEQVVTHTVDLLYEETDAFDTLMQLTSSDYYTYTHSVNVFVFSVTLAQALGIDPASVREFGQGTLLHDIGKSRLPNDLLNFKGHLSPEQWAQMKQHPTIGYDLLREQGVKSDIILEVTRSHHEKLNGRGYPDGLTSGDISPWVRMATICDIFDALTTRRSYKDAMESFQSLELMKSEMSDELDPDFFRTFVGVMGRCTGTKTVSQPRFAL